MDYDSLGVGREMDALVAEKVMGWKRMTYGELQGNDRKGMSSEWHLPDGKTAESASAYLGRANAEDTDDYYTPEEAWSPSINIGAAWEVVEFLKNIRHYRVTITWGGDECPGWFVGLIADGYRSFLDQKWDSSGDTAPLAICRAALKAVA